MSAERALRQLADALQAPRTTSVLIASKVSDEDHFERLTLHADLATQFREVAQTAVPSPNDNELVLRPYEAGYKPDRHELPVLTLTNAPEIAEIVSELARVDQAESFTADEETISGLRFYSIVITVSARRHGVFFRTYSQKKELSRSRLFAAMLRGGAYNKVTQKVFLFDDDIDCFAWDGYLYVKHVANFQRIFEYFERLREDASIAVDTVAQRVPVQNLDQFKAACIRQPQMMAKIVQISRKPYLQGLAIADIKRTIQEFSLPVQLVTDGDAEKLVFENDRKKRWLILKLLDDDYLGSIMTRQKYEVNSKSALQP